MRSPDYNYIVEQMMKIHERKNHDYSNEENPFANFDIAAQLVAHFKDPADQVFVTLIGVKIARLAELLNTGKEPLNEPTEDSFIDGPNYFALWGGHRRRRARLAKENDERFRRRIMEVSEGPLPADSMPLG